MLNGLAGYLSGFDGDFGFDAIGDKYAEHNVSRLAPFRLALILELNPLSCVFTKVPYVPMRQFVALMGSLTIPVIYMIMRESGYPVLIAAFSACLVLFGQPIPDSR
jgi:dolichyl-phosphate-mannose-protein mannosyltransferase